MNPLFPFLLSKGIKPIQSHQIDMILSSKKNASIVYVRQRGLDLDVLVVACLPDRKHSFNLEGKKGGVHPTLCR